LCGSPKAHILACAWEIFVGRKLKTSAQISIRAAMEGILFVE
jgi:hypothetical protein